MRIMPSEQPIDALQAPVQVKEMKLTAAVLGLECIPPSQQDPLQLLVAVC